MTPQSCQSGRALNNSTSLKEDKNNQLEKNNISLAFKHNFHEFSEFEMLSHYSHKLYMLSLGRALFSRSFRAREGALPSISLSLL